MCCVPGVNEAPIKAPIKAPITLTPHVDIPDWQHKVTVNGLWRPLGWRHHIDLFVDGNLEEASSVVSLFTIHTPRVVRVLSLIMDHLYYDEALLMPLGPCSVDQQPAVRLSTNVEVITLQNYSATITFSVNQKLKYLALGCGQNVLPDIVKGLVMENCPFYGLDVDSPISLMNNTPVCGLTTGDGADPGPWLRTPSGGVFSKPCANASANHVWKLRRAATK